MVKKSSVKQGFTLIEILVVIGLIAILAAIVLIAINPGRQFAQARNSQRVSNVEAIVSAIGQNIADNKGIFTCAAGTLPSSVTEMKKTSGYDVRPCIVPKYMSEIPFDPGTASGVTGVNTCVDTTAGDCATSGSYNTTYTVKLDSATGRITVAAPNAELAQTISITR